MRSILSTLIATLAIVLVAMGGSAQGSSCGNYTLHGSYAFRVSGEVFVPPSPPPASPLPVVANYRDGVAMTTFDGNGNLRQVDWVMSNGAVVPGPPDPYGFHDMETGTYTVNPDCTGTAVINFPTPPHGTSGAVITLNFVIGDEGRTIHTIVSSLTPPNTTTPVPANIHSDAVKVGGD